MRWIDRYAYNNRISRLDPAYKAGFSLVIILVCLLSGRWIVSAIIILLVLGMNILWAGVAARFVLRLLTAEASFLIIGVLGVAVNIHISPTGSGLAMGDWRFLVTPESIDLAGKLFMRALGCASAMNFLATTTPLVDIIDLLRRIHLPELLIDLMTLIYRFTFILLDSLERMVTAHEVRLGFNGWRNSLHSTANIGANLFIEAFRRSQRLETALEGRCWDGTLHVLPQEYERLRWPW